MDRKILIILAHPLYERSRITKALVIQSKSMRHVTIHDLYERYPEFNIDVETEKKALESHDIIVWLHPIYWYNCPPLFKQWLDLVLEINWAYGPQGKALSGKIVVHSVSTGGREEAYHPEGTNRFDIRTLLSPFDQTAHLCKMVYLAPFVIHGSHKITDDELSTLSNKWLAILTALQQMEDIPTSELQKLSYLNHWIIPNTPIS